MMIKSLDKFIQSSGYKGLRTGDYHEQVILMARKEYPLAFGDRQKD